MIFQCETEIAIAQFNFYNWDVLDLLINSVFV